jgi:TonB family protein
MQRVPGWRFTPASLDGVPAAAESTLRVFLEGEPDGKGGYTMRITRAHTGPRALKRPAPKYPQRELKRHRAGSVLLRVEVQADGSVAKVEADEEYSDAGFVAASVQAVRRWTFEPERIGGQPVPTRLEIPVSFNLYGKPREKPRWSESNPELDEHPQALDSAIGPITGLEEE